MLTNEMVYLTLSDNNPRQVDVYIESQQLFGSVVYENEYDKDNYPLFMMAKNPVNNW